MRSEKGSITNPETLNTMSTEKQRKKNSSTPVDKPWTRSVESVLEEFGVDREKGLSKKEAGARRRRYGANRLEQRSRKPAWTILADQFKNLIVLLLTVAAVLSFSFGQWLEGCSITVAIFINAAIGFFTELKAVRSMEALQQMSRVDAAQLGVTKARRSLEGLYMASDAFFPFRDGIDAAAEAGIRAVIEPGGSKRDQEVIDAADEHGMILVFTGMRHFRH